MDALAQLFQGRSMRAYARMGKRWTGCPPQSLVGGNRIGSHPALQTVVLERARRGLTTQVVKSQAEQPQLAPARVGSLAGMKPRLLLKYTAFSSDSDKGKRRRFTAAFYMGSLAVGLSGSYYTMTNWSGTQKVRRITGSCNP